MRPAYELYGYPEARAFVRTLAKEELFELYPRTLRGPIGVMAVVATARLIELGDPAAVDVAVAALTAPAGPWAHHAVRVVHRLGGERAVPALLELVPRPGHPGSAGAGWAVVALGRIGDATAAEALIAAAEQLVDRAAYRQRGGEAYVEDLVWALCRLGTAAGLDTVLALTRTMHGLWEERTLRALVPVADERFVPFFLELCAGPRRAVGLAGLERVATPRAVPALRGLFDSPATDRRTHRTVTRALMTAYGDEVRWRLAPEAGAGARNRRAFAWILGRRGQGTTRHLTRYPEALLTDEDATVRGQAATSLGLIGDPRAVPSLLAALGDPSHHVRARAATALGRDPAAATALAHLAETDPVRTVRAAAAAAARH